MNRHLSLIFFLVSVLSTVFLQTTSGTTGLIQESEENKSEKNISPRFIVYKNKQYRFRVSLPASWKHFSIDVGTWHGSKRNKDGQIVGEISGPTIAIRHPLWSEKNPHQDIPIMIFTKEKWSLVEKEVTIGTAPFGPSEIGRNRKYVFALPARYNYALPIGWEEVEKIIAQNSLHPY